MYLLVFPSFAWLAAIGCVRLGCNCDDVIGYEDARLLELGVTLVAGRLHQQLGQRQHGRQRLRTIDLAGSIVWLLLLQHIVGLLN